MKKLEQIGYTARFAAALHDKRHGPFVDHSFAQMCRSRIYGILAGYADQNDHDQLRYDPVFKLLAGRRPSDDELASQPTLSRFENAIDIGVEIVFRDGPIAHFMLRNCTTFLDEPFAVPSISCCNFSRARDRRDITVPTGISSTLAASA